ncbi:MAG: nitroreductase [Crocinitomicaceae bacterium]|nr:nitroreductase [Crocinitomicaceae bacterium]
MKFNLSEITELIRTRRSVRPELFNRRKIHREQLELILNNAIWAPSHGMTQPWRFSVFFDEGLKKISDFLPELYKSTVSPGMFKQAKYDRLKERPLLSSAVIAVSMERDKSEKIAEIEEIEAVACAIQNMYLTCTAYGIGAYWSSPSMIYNSKMNDFLGLEEKGKCLSLFYLGYTDEEWPTSHRRPVEYVTKWIVE